jgi:tetratricopeptide (TPR) repeat protein
MCSSLERMRRFGEKPPRPGRYRYWDVLRALALALYGPGDPRVWGALSRAARALLDEGAEIEAAAACAAGALEGLERAALAPGAAGVRPGEPGCGGNPEAASVNGASAAGAADGADQAGAPPPAPGADRAIGPGEPWPRREEIEFARKTLDAARAALALRSPDAPFPAPSPGAGEAIWPLRSSGGVPEPGPDALREELASAEGRAGTGSREALDVRSRLGAALAAMPGHAGAGSPGEARALLREASEGLDALLGADRQDALEAKERYAAFLKGDFGEGRPLLGSGPEGRPPEGDLKEAFELYGQILKARSDFFKAEVEEPPGPPLSPRRSPGRAGPFPLVFDMLPEDAAPLAGPAEALREDGAFLAGPAAALREDGAFLAGPAEALREDGAFLAGPAAALREDGAFLEGPAAALKSPAPLPGNADAALKRAVPARTSAVAPSPRGRSNFEATLTASVHCSEVAFELNLRETARRLRASAFLAGEEELDPYHPIMLRIMAGFSESGLWEGATLDDVSKMARFAAEGMREVLGFRSRETLRATGRLAAMVRRQGKSLYAMSLMAEVLEVLEAAGGSGDPSGRDAKSLRVSIAEALCETGDAASAPLVIGPAGTPGPEWGKECAVRALRVLGLSSQRSGDAPGAERHLRRALEIHGPAPGDSAAYAVSLGVLGLHLLSEGGDPREARALFEEEAEVRTRLSGPESAGALTALFHSAQAASAGGEQEEALDLHRKVLESRKRKLGLFHPDTERSGEAVRRLEGMPG